MFGHRFYGANYFGPRYFGPSSGSLEAEVVTLAVTPASGPRGVPSAAWTAGLDDPSPIDVIITPVDLSGQGSFDPAFVVILAGQVTAQNTFTYTPTTSGVRNINATNNAGLGGPTSVEYTATAVPEATLSGTAATGLTPERIVAGGRTIVLTLLDDTWVAAGATFDAQRQAIINGIDSAQAEAAGWDAVVKAGLQVTDVVRTSNTVVTITLPAFPSYSVTASETITATIPAAALTAAGALVAPPSFRVTVAGVGGAAAGIMRGSIMHHGG